VSEKRQAAINGLIAAKKKESKIKSARVRKAAVKLVNGTELLTVSSVARPAGVSGWLIYNTPELKTAVSRGAAQQRATWAQGHERAGMTPKGAVTELLRLQERLATVTRQRDHYQRSVKLMDCAVRSPSWRESPERWQIAGSRGRPAVPDGGVDIHGFAIAMLIPAVSAAAAVISMFALPRRAVRVVGAALVAALALVAFFTSWWLGATLWIRQSTGQPGIPGDPGGCAEEASCTPATPTVVVDNGGHLRSSRYQTLYIAP
jgi:hypothetical protein